MLTPTKHASTSNKEERLISVEVIYDECLYDDADRRTIRRDPQEGLACGLEGNNTGTKTAFRHTWSILNCHTVTYLRD